MASSVEKGDAFEDRVYDFICTEILENRFYLKSDCCQVFKKKKYYSKDRSANIVFDVVVEVRYPGSEDCALILIFECKDHGKPVVVGDVEAFYQKVEQVAGAKAKLILASVGPLQKSARSFAISKGMGVLRYFDSREFKWEARRSPSMSLLSSGKVDFPESEYALSEADFQSHAFDFYFESQSGVTVSAWDFFAEITKSVFGDIPEKNGVLNNAPEHCQSIPFLDEAAIEERAMKILSGIGYRGGVVDVEKICGQIDGLVLRKHQNSKLSILGVVRFDPLEIDIYESGNSQRDKFSIAHEASHVLLGHGRYIKKDIFDVDDIEGRSASKLIPADIVRMEWQANHMAACLLMPREIFIQDCLRVLRETNIKSRGFGRLFLDEQPCNKFSYMAVTGRLKRIYDVSRSAVHIRMESLGILVDARNGK